MKTRIPSVFFSHRLDSLAESLIQQLDLDFVGPLKTRTILVPNTQIKQWLLLEIASKRGIAMGLRVMEIEQFLAQNSLDKLKLSPSSLEQFCLIFKALSTSSDGDLHNYLSGKDRRVLDLTEKLNKLFSNYGQLGSHLFDVKGQTDDWQHSILRELFVDGPWQLSIQQGHLYSSEPIYCFGIDYTPFWDTLCKLPNISIFLFSPCKDFWEDLCSYPERKKMNRYLKKRGATETSRIELDSYLREVPPLLANLGKLGRETLKCLDSYDLQIEDSYPHVEDSSLLEKIQSDLLHFQLSKNKTTDESIKVFLTGSSRLKEVECLRDEIISLKIPFREIVVLAPDIEPYVPLIEFVFGDQIPFSISGFDIAPQSSFRQGLVHILNLVSSRWEVEAIITLFETPAFYRKQGWDEETVQLFCKWIGSAHIHWGLNAAHRTDTLSEIFGSKDYEDQGSWEKGLDHLLDSIVYLRPLQINPDLFNEFLSLFMTLYQLPLKGEKTLALWADSLELLAKNFLLADTTSEADNSAQNAFAQFIQDLRQCRVEGSFPFAVIQTLVKRPCFGQIHSSHLHAVRFCPIDQGASLPATALFLMGMDEESFPRNQSDSSLDLLKGRGVNQADRDRYLFLQTLFSAQKYLRISYGHLSADEGKPIGPSLLVQELLSEIGSDISSTYRTSPIHTSHKKVLFWPRKTNGPLPQGEMIIPISELRQLARHPWKFYLQKVHGMYLDTSLEDSFALQRGLLLGATLERPLNEVLKAPELPQGPLGQALRLEISEKADVWQKQLTAWDIKPFSLHFRENCLEGQWEESNYISPSLVLNWPNLKVRLVGEIRRASLKGLISSQDDSVAGLLKVWPEALIVAMALDTPNILMLKSGKCKELEHFEKHLMAFVEYYLCCLTSPSPLLVDWADAFLRKGAAELAKTIEKGSLFEDPVIDWVLARTELSSAEELYEQWGPYLKRTFAALSDLYPSRGKAHATV